LNDRGIGYPRKQLTDKPTALHPRRHRNTAKQKGNRTTTLNLQRTTSELAEKIAALPERYP
jgi:hypothetical protein